MRIRKKAWARPELSACPFYIRQPEEYRGKWSAAFKNPGPLHLDLGCGKCVFLAEIACEHRDINYVGIDISLDILGVGRRNIIARRGAEEPDNVLLFDYNIEKLGELFSSEDGIERIYISFCNPWPKARDHKKRLSSTGFLNMYKTFLKPGGEIWFKTDNDDLYIASKRYFREAGLNIFLETEDLHAADKENTFTEHEEMFTAEGIKTKAIRAKKEN